MSVPVNSPVSMSVPLGSAAPSAPGPRLPGWGGKVLRVAIAFIVPLAIDFVLLSLIFLFGANDLVGDSLTPVGVVIKVVILVTVIALNLGLAWLLVTRLDRRPLSDLRLRFDRRALIWFLAMIATALLMAVIMEVVLGFLGYEPSTENYSSVPVSAVILYVIDRIRAAFLQQGFPEELVWRGWLFTSLGGTRAAGIVSVVFFTLMHLGSSGGQQNWIDHLIYLAWPFGFAVAAVVALWASGSTWAAVGVHVGAHMMWIVEMFMHVSLEQPVARLLEGALWLVVAAVIWLLARRGILRKAP